MNLMILGAGGVGRSMAAHAVAAGHNVTLVDTLESKLALAAESLDVQTVHGHAAHPSVLRQAGAASADLVLAVTGNDEANLLACQLAYSLWQVPRKIARVTHEEYLNLIAKDIYDDENLPVDVLVAPYLDVAQAAYRALKIRSVFQVTPVLDGAGAVWSATLPEEEATIDLNVAPVPVLGVGHGKQFKVLNTEKALTMPVCGTVHVYVPMGEEVAAQKWLGQGGKRFKHVMILGGGRIGRRVASWLLRDGISVKIVEKSAKRAEELAHELPQATVLHADATDLATLEQENLGKMDAVLTVTHDDATNILASVAAHQAGCDNVLTLVNNGALVPVAKRAGLQQILGTADSTVENLVCHLAPEKPTVHVLGSSAFAVAEVPLQATLPKGVEIFTQTEAGQLVLGKVKALNKCQGSKAKP